MFQEQSKNWKLEEEKSQKPIKSTLKFIWRKTRKEEKISEGEVKISPIAGLTKRLGRRENELKLDCLGHTRHPLSHSVSKPWMHQTCKSRCSMCWRHTWISTYFIMALVLFYASAACPHHPTQCLCSAHSMPFCHCCKSETFHDTWHSREARSSSEMSKIYFWCLMSPQIKWSVAVSKMIMDCWLKAKDQ